MLVVVGVIPAGSSAHASVRSSTTRDPAIASALLDCSQRQCAGSNFDWLGSNPVLHFGSHSGLTAINPTESSSDRHAEQNGDQENACYTHPESPSNALMIYR
jgi:hypothetical protein